MEDSGCLIFFGKASLLTRPIPGLRRTLRHHPSLPASSPMPTYSVNWSVPY
jgi:hypothetical protein